MFMCYDCQPYSANLAIKLIKCMSIISQNKFNVDTENDGVLIIQDSVQTQIQYLEIMSSFLKKLNMKPINKDAQEKLKFLLANKNKLSKLEKTLKEKGRKDLNSAIQNYVEGDAKDCDIP